MTDDADKDEEIEVEEEENTLMMAVLIFYAAVGSMQTAGGFRLAPARGHCAAPDRLWVPKQNGRITLPKRFRYVCIVLRPFRASLNMHCCPVIFPEIVGTNQANMVCFEKRGKLQDDEEGSLGKNITQRNPKACRIKGFSS